MSAVTIVWFRHDLRLDDNPAFLEATQRGSVLPVFIWAPEEEALGSQVQLLVGGCINHWRVFLRTQKLGCRL